MAIRIASEMKMSLRDTLNIYGMNEVSLFPDLDSRIELRAVRLAADGVWLERIMNAKSKNLRGVEECLIEMTRIH